MIVSMLALGGLWLNSERLAAEEREKEESDRKNVAEAGRLKEKHLREAADRQRELAEQNFKLAEEAVDQLLTSISHANLAYDPHLLDFRRDLLEKAGVLPRLAVRGEDQAVRNETAHAFYRLAYVNQVLDDFDNAEKNYQKAIECSEELVKKWPKARNIKKPLRLPGLSLGLLWQLQGRLLDSEHAFVNALKLFGKLVKEDPAERASHQADLANIHLNLGILFLALGQFQDAEPSFDEALRLPLALAPEIDLLARQGLAKVQLNRGIFLWRIGKQTEAEQSLLPGKTLPC